MIKRMLLQNGLIVEDSNGSANILVYVAPDEAEKRELIEKHGIDEYSIASALDPDELSRVEQSVDHMIIILKCPKNYSSEDKFVLKVHSMGIFILADRLIIVMTEENPILLPRFYNQMNSLLDVTLRLILRVIHHFNEHLKVVNMISGEIEEQINASMENSSLIQLFALEKSLVYYVNSISSNGAMIERLRMNAQKPATFGFQPEHLEHLDDLLIENRQTYEQAHIYSDILAGLMDARVSIVSNNLNILMRNLTLVMIACMWPPLVCGFFAMNIRLPFNHESLHPFYWVLAISFVPLAVATIYYWWRWRR